MREELERFRSETRAVFADVEKLVVGLSDEQARTRPAVGEWSIAECLDHLTLTVRAYEPAIEEYLAAGSPQGGSSYRPGWLWRKFVESMEPPVKRKYKTAAPFVPAGARGLEEARRDFFAAHQWVLDKLDALDTLDLGRIKVESPFAKWMRYPLGLVFYILPAHCRRHVWQAENVKASMVSGART
jgi:hypothetical protein